MMPQPQNRNIFDRARGNKGPISGGTKPQIGQDNSGGTYMENYTRDLESLVNAVTKQNREIKTPEEAINTRESQAQAPQQKQNTEQQTREKTPLQQMFDEDVREDAIDGGDSIFKQLSNAFSKRVQKAKEAAASSGEPDLVNALSLGAESIAQNLQQVQQIDSQKKNRPEKTDGVSIFENLDSEVSNILSGDFVKSKKDEYEQKTKEDQDRANLETIIDVLRFTPVIGTLIHANGEEWAKDAITSFAMKKNEAEIDTSLGKIILNHEKLQYIELKNLALSKIVDYLQAKSIIRELKQSGRTDPETLKTIQDLQFGTQNLLTSLYDMRKAIVDGESYTEDQFESTREQFGDALHRGYQAKDKESFFYKDIPFDSILNYISKFTTDDETQNISDIHVAGAKDLLRLHSEFLNHKRKEADVIRKKMEAEINIDIQDLKEWKNAHTVSDYYLKKEKENQESGMKLLDPDTYMYGMWGTLGSSASNNGYQLASQALGLIGNGLLYGSPEPISKTIGGALIGGSALLGYKSGELENQAEVAENFTQRLSENMVKYMSKEDIKRFTQTIRELAPENREVNTLEDGIRELMLLPEGARLMLLSGEGYQLSGDNNNRLVSEEKIAHDAEMWRNLTDLVNISSHGTNNLFQNDMVATTTDVVVQGLINTLIPLKTMAKDAVITPGSKMSRARKLVEWGQKHPQAYELYRSASSKIGSYASNVSGSPVASAVNPILGAGYSAVKPAVTYAKNKVGSLIPEAAKIKFSNAISKATNALDEALVGATHGNAKWYMDARELSKIGARGTGRWLTGNWSEALEEGKQFQHGQSFVRGELDGERRSLMESFISDLQMGTRSAYSFVGGNLFGLQIDPEFMTNMNGGWIGGATHTAPMTAYNTAKMSLDQLSANNIIMNNVMAFKAEDQHTLISGEQFAKMSTPGKFTAMMNAFDAMKEYQHKLTQYGIAIDSQRVQDDAGNYLDNYGNITTEENAARVIRGFNDEDIDAQRNIYKHVYSLTNNANVIGAAKDRGIKEKTPDYYRYISVLNYINTRINDTARDYRDQLNEQNALTRAALEAVYNVHAFDYLGLPPQASQEFKNNSQNTEALNAVRPEDLYGDYLSNLSRSQIEQRINEYNNLKPGDPGYFTLPEVKRLDNESDEEYADRANQQAREFIRIGGYVGQQQVILARIRALTERIAKLNQLENSGQPLTHAQKAQREFLKYKLQDIKTTYNDDKIIQDAVIQDSEGFSANINDYIVDEETNKLLAEEFDKDYMLRSELEPLIELRNQMLGKGLASQLMLNDPDLLGILNSISADVQSQIENDKSKRNMLLSAFKTNERNNLDDPVKQILKQWEDVRIADNQFASNLSRELMERMASYSSTLYDLEEENEDQFNPKDNPATAPYTVINGPQVQVLNKDGIPPIGQSYGKRNMNQPYVSPQQSNLIDILYDRFLNDNKSALQRSSISKKLQQLVNGKELWKHIIDRLILGDKFIEKQSKQGNTNYYRVYNDPESLIGESGQKITKSEYQWAQYVYPVVKQIKDAIVTTNDPVNASQQATLDALTAYHQQTQAGFVKEYATGHDYFFWENGKLVRRNRVHTIIDDMYANTTEEQMYIDALTQSLQELQQQSIADFKVVIKQFESDYNNYVLNNYFGTRKDQVYVNFDGYCHDDVVNDPVICEHISSLMKGIYSEEVGNQIRKVMPSVTENQIGRNKSWSGSLELGLSLDEIYRRTYAGETVSNDPIYKMSDDVFNNVVEKAKADRESIISKGFVISTVEYLFKGETADGTPIAGVTDMIVIHPNGNLSIVDFKTSNLERIKYDKTRTYLKGKYDGTPEQHSEYIADAKDVFLTYPPIPYSFLGPAQFSSTSKQYEQQLTGYFNIVTQSLRNAGVQVESTQIALIATSPITDKSKNYALSGVKYANYIGRIAIGQSSKINDLFFNPGNPIPPGPPAPPGPPTPQPTPPIIPNRPRVIFNDMIPTNNIDHEKGYENLPVHQRHQFMLDAVKPDFIQNSVWEFTIVNNKVKLNIEYNGTVYEGFTIEFLSDNVGRTLANKVVSLLTDPNRNGRRVIVTQKRRSKGLIHNGNTLDIITNTPLMPNPAALLTLIQDNKIGIANNQNGHTIIQALTVGNQKISIYDAQEHNVPDGLIVYMYDPQYAESTGTEHFIPVTLYANKLAPSDVDLIVDIITNPHLLDRQAERNNLRLPFTNRQILGFLTRFEKPYDQTNKFEFHYKINDDNTYNNEVVVLNGTGYDLTNQVRINDLKDALLETQMNIDKSHLAHNLNSNVDDAKNNPFLNLVKFFNENPTVNSIDLSDNLKISIDDVTQNFNGIAWRLKYGQLKTAFDHIEDPRLSIDDVEYESQQAPPTQPPTTLSQDTTTDELLDGTNVDNSAWFDPDAYMNGSLLSKRKSSEKPLNRELAKSRIRRILGDTFGNDFSIVLGEEAEDVLSSMDVSIMGLCTSDAIIIRDSAEQGVEFHEAFHRVLELLMSDKKREYIYKKYRQHFNDQELNDRQVAEGLADIYMDFRNKLAEAAELPWLGNVFNKIKLWTEAWASVIRNNLLLTALRIYVGVYRGKQPTSERIKRFSEKYGNLAYTTTVNNKDITLQHFNNQTEVDDMATTIFQNVFAFSHIDVFVLNSTKSDGVRVDFSKNVWKNIPMLKNILELAESKPENEWSQTKDGRLLLKYKDFYDHWDELKPLIDRKLASIGFGSIQEEEDENTENNQSAESISMSIAQHTAPAYTKPKSNQLALGLRYFLSTFKNERYVTEQDVEKGLATSVYYPAKDGKVKRRRTIPVAVNSLGLVQYMDMHEVYNRLMIEFNDVSTVEELDKRLTEKSNESPFFRKVAETFHRAKDMSIVYHQENGRKVKPVVVKNGKKLDVNSYETRQDGNGRWHIFSKDSGVEIPGAEIVVNYDYESFTTLLFQAIKSQKLDFVFCFASNPIINGNRDTNSYNYRIRSTNAVQSAIMYPASWFNNMRNGTTGVFKFNKQSELVLRDAEVFKTVSDTFNKVIDSVSNIEFGQNKKSVITIGGKDINYFTPEGFDYLIAVLCDQLRQVGISVHPAAFEFTLNALYPGKSRYDAFIDLFRRVDDISVRSFANMLSTIYSNLSKSNDILLKDTKQTGVNLYANNGFVKLLAEGFAKYINATQEMNTLGPGDTSLFTMSQNNTASDITDDLNKAYVDELGNIQGSEVASDMIKWEYNLMRAPFDESQRIATNVLWGSCILKYLHRKNRVKLDLKTHVGMNMENTHDGGVKYTEISERDDFLAKATILESDGIIFPTLSDKSTWFYISASDRDLGLKLPGINYDDIANSPLITLIPGSSMIKFDSNDTYDKVGEHPALDQFIEYAYCERAAIIKTMNQLHLNDASIGNNPVDIVDDKEKVDNFHTTDSGIVQGARFSTLTGVYEIVDGKEVWVSFNNSKKSEIENLQIADEHFFSKSKDEQRALILRIQQHHLDDTIEWCERQGIIRVDKTKRKYLGISNILLPSETINKLTSEYQKKYKNGYEPLRSLAICTYLLDINMKSMMSLEEVERLYTGHPAFFKWLYNDETGELVDRMFDEVKRFGGLGSTGENNRQDLPNVESEYTCAEIKDYKTGSPIIEDLHSSFEESEFREAYYLLTVQQQPKHDYIGRRRVWDEVYGENKISIDDIKKKLGTASTAVIQDKIDNEVKSLKSGIDVADGSAFITDRMAEKLLRQRGKYTSQVAEAFEYLRGKRVPKFEVEDKDGKKRTVKGRILTDGRAYKIIHDALIGTQKYSAFGYRMQNDILVHYYNKFALFPLFENVATGFMNNIYHKMINQGVDMLMMKSAVKVGGQGAQDLRPESFRYNDDPTDERNFIDGDVGGQNWKQDWKQFEFNTYKQKYQWIRRQLNTDPRTSETMPVGTQVIKVGLSNLNLDKPDYKNPYGRNIDGRTLRQRVTTCLNAISEKQKQQLLDKLQTNGEYDINKISQFLIDQFQRRDADRNLLDGLRIVNGQFDVPLIAQSSVNWIQSIVASEIDKSVIDVNLPGNAYYQRSVFAMEGYPIEVDVLSDSNITNYSVNDGKPLQMCNEEGSRDAVISYDYFMHLVPKEIRYNVKKGRQWLIDNGVIGKNAKANTISYRIPTQAESSVHALRFVDVLPTVRDTIILPKEFTAITGSDFDIDKLFLSTYDYSLAIREKNRSGYEDVTVPYAPKHREIRLSDLLFGNEEDSMVNILDGTGISVKQNTPYPLLTQARQNRDQNKFINNQLVLLKNELLHYYIELGKQGGVNSEDGFSNGTDSHYLYRSIDNDTKLIKKALSQIEGSKELKPYISYQFGSLINQVQTKSAFIGGKLGIAPFALANNNQVLTSIFEVDFAENKDNSRSSLLSQLGMTKLSSKFDKRMNSKFSWLSGLINANVDVTKDAYISRMNVNPYTYNMLNLLVRTGMADTSFFFIGQPVLKELTQIYMRESGVIGTVDGLTKSKRQANAIDDYVRKTGPLAAVYNNYIKPYFDKTGVANWPMFYAAIRQIFGLDKQGEHFTDNHFYYNIETKKANESPISGCILLDILRNPAARINPEKPATLDNLHNNPMYAIHYIERENGVEVEQWNYFSPLQIQALVYVTKQKLDTYSNALSELVMTTRIDTKKQGNTLAEQQDYVDRYEQFKHGSAKLFTSEVYTLLSEFTDTKTYSSYDLFKDILAQHLLAATNAFAADIQSVKEYVDSYEAQGKIDNAIVGMYKARFFRDYIRENNINAKDLFVGFNSIPARLQRLIYNIVNDKTGKYSNYVTNGFITNELISNLMEDLYTQIESLDNPRFIRLNKSKIDGSTNQNAIRNAWLQMYNDTKIPGMRKFAIDLALYAFLTSADTNGFNKFFRYVPNEIKKELTTNQYGSYVDYMRDLLIQYQGAGITSMLSLDQIDDIILNNWSDDSFVPVIKQKNVFGRIYNPKFDGARQQMYTIFGGLAGNKVTIKTNRFGNYPRFVKIKLDTYNYRDSNQYVVYKYIGEGMTSTGIIYPVYAMTYPKGHSVKAGSYRYTIYEYCTGKTGDNYVYYIGNDLYGFDISDYYDRLFEGIQTQIDQSSVSIDEVQIEIPSGVLSKDDPYANLIRDMYRRDITQDGDPDIKTDTPTLLSGGAEGADVYFKNIAEQHGITEQYHFYYREQTPYGTFRISDQAYLEGVDKVRDVVNVIRNGRMPEGRRLELTARNWYQVKYADAIYAVSFIVPNLMQERGEEGYVNMSGKQIVSGGTGYAVEMAIQRGLPVYVYNQFDMYNIPEGWYTWDYVANEFVPCEKPKLVTHFAGIGSRELLDSGKKAIESLFEGVQYDPIDNIPADPLNITQENAKPERKTAMYGVVIDKNLMQNYKQWMKDNPTGIVAFRTDRNNYNTPEFAYNGIIGNPFDWTSMTGMSREEAGKKATFMFYKWLHTGDNQGEPKATDEYRKAIMYRIMKSSPEYTKILYYEEKGYPTHATVIGWFIRNVNQLYFGDYANESTNKPNTKTLSTAEQPLQIYSDGSHIKGTTQIGYGAVFEYNGRQYGLSGTEQSIEVTKLKNLFSDAEFSNPTMEMLALTSVLEYFANTGKSEHIQINQDYKGAVNYGKLWSYSEGSQQREAKPWRASKPYIIHLVDRAVDAIERIQQNGGSVKINWVKGHQGSVNTEQARMNDGADRFAKDRSNFNNIDNAYSGSEIQQQGLQQTNQQNNEFNNNDEYPPDAMNYCKT